jgi:serine/threonine protein kinase
MNRSTALSPDPEAAEAQARPEPAQQPDPGPVEAGDDVEALPGLSHATEVGRGANAVVYRAWQERLERWVAVKVLTHATDDPVARGRFQREIKALAALSWHPNIVTLLDAGTTSTGRPYLVMALLSGGSLHDRVRREGPLPWAIAADLGMRLFDAIGAAHRSGVLHRDIKPSNVLLGGDGQPELADFGIAFLGDHDLTRTGWFMGALGYTAPEVMMGERPTTASDVFSLAATLVTVLTGQPPWPDQGDGPIGLLGRQRTDPPPDLTRWGVPADAARLLRAALGTDPAERPLGVDLREALAASVPGAAGRAGPDLAKPNDDGDPTVAVVGGTHPPSDPTRIEGTDRTSVLPVPVPAPVPPRLAPPPPPPPLPPPQQSPSPSPHGSVHAPPETWGPAPASPPVAWYDAPPAAAPAPLGAAPVRLRPVRAAAVAFVAAGAATLAASSLVPWVGDIPLADDELLRPAGLLVLLVAVQWGVLAAHAARFSRRASLVGLVGVVGVVLGASATRTNEDLSADPFSPPGVTLALLAAGLATIGFALLAATAGQHRASGFRCRTPWLRTITATFWSVAILGGLAGSPWFGTLEGGDWTWDVLWFRQGAPWVPMVAACVVQLVLLARPLSHARWSAPALGALTAAVVAVGTGLDSIPRIAEFDPTNQSGFALLLLVSTACAALAALAFLSMLTFEAGRPDPPPPPPRRAPRAPAPHTW